MAKNYRPISILPTISKVYESVLNKQIICHFETNNLFNKDQFGFRQKRNTSDATIELLKKVIYAMENEEYCGIVLCDLQKAFDCVSFKLMLEKLKRYNFDTISLNLLKSYLTNRRQYTLLNNTPSVFRNIVSGVPQGSVLGPTLFLIYINEISNAIPEAKLVLFADDTTAQKNNAALPLLKTSLKSVQETLSLWFAANFLSLNNTKTKHVIFSHRLSQTDSIENVRFLGLSLDSKLNWASHVNTLSSKLATSTYVVRSLIHLVPFDVVKNAYYSLFYSHMTYGLIVWGHSHHSTRIFGLQRKILRIMCGLKYRAETRDKFVTLRILTFPCLYIFVCLKYVKQNLNLYTTNREIHYHGTRRENEICTTYLRLNSSRNGTNYFGPKFYNKLPDSVKTLPIKNFIKIIKNFLLSNAFFNLDEYFSYNFNDIYVLQHI